MQIPFEVDVVLCIASPLLQSRLSNLALPDSEIIDNCGDFRFSVRHVEDPDAVAPAIRAAQQRQRALILVSDRLAVAASEGYAPSPFAIRCRDAINSGLDSAGAMMALIEGDVVKTRDIVGMVDVRQAHVLEAIREEVRRVADGIWLKTSVRLPDTRTDTDAIRVGLATQLKSLVSAFHLRHRVYKTLGYLDERMAEDPGALELDQFDTGALHFVAVDSREGVVGTARLITDVSQAGSSFVPSLARIMKRQIGSITHIAESEPLGDDTSVALRRDRIRNRPFTPFPILENSDFGDRWPEFLHQYSAADCGELSRLVVAPRYRGLGVAAMLIRAVIAFAADMQKRYLILECVPQHVHMYERFGFRTLEGHHCRAQDVDQIAIGMALDLKAAANVADGDLKMLQFTGRELKQSPFLCTCRTRSCSQHGAYPERGKAVCPLKGVFEATAAAAKW